MFSISLSREFGSGGDQIALRVAERLGIPLLDRELLEAACQSVEPGVIPAYESCQAASRSLEESTIGAEEPRSLASRLVQAISGGTKPWPRLRPSSPIPVGEEDSLLRLLVPTDLAYADTMTLVFARVLEQGQAVFLGRGGQVILANHPRVLHVHVTAPVSSKVRRVAAEEGISEAEASEKVRRIDGERGRYIRRYYSADWLDPSLYHITINTGRLSDDGAVDLIIRAAELMTADALNDR